MSKVEGSNPYQWKLVESLTHSGKWKLVESLTHSGKWKLVESLTHSGKWKPLSKWFTEAINDFESLTHSGKWKTLLVKIVNFDKGALKLEFGNKSKVFKGEKSWCRPNGPPKT